MAKRAYALGDYDPGTRSVPVLASTTNPIEGEALVSWDLSRFEKNPTILWCHDSCAMPLGEAREVAFDPKVGLTMRIFFGSPLANPFITQVEEAVRTKLIKGVSVGFDIGPDVPIVLDGKPGMARGPAILCEVSFCPIPKDEDAGTAALHADASEIKRGEDLHVDATMSKVQWTAWGTARIPARISRVGVLDYPGRREFRPPTEVLKPESVESLRGMPVIDIADHTGYVLPKDFRRKVLGFVEEAHVDGDFVAGTLHIQDADTIERIKNGERLDVSAGYYAPTVPQVGTWRGERYDVVQKDIIYNHVALCPPGRGRAGPDVGLKLDGQDEESAGGEVGVIVNEGVRPIGA